MGNNNEFQLRLDDPVWRRRLPAIRCALGDSAAEPDLPAWNPRG